MALDTVSALKRESTQQAQWVAYDALPQVRRSHAPVDGRAPWLHACLQPVRKELLAALLLLQMREPVLLSMARVELCGR